MLNVLLQGFGHYFAPQEELVAGAYLHIGFDGEAVAFHGFFYRLEVDPYFAECEHHGTGCGARDHDIVAHNRDIIKKHWAQGVHTVSGMLLKVDEKCMTVTLYDRHGTLIDQVKILAKR